MKEILASSEMPRYLLAIFVHRATEAADLIINVGHDVVEKPPFFMEHNGVKVIHINFSSAAVDAVYFPHVEVVGDIAQSITDIHNRLKKQSHWDFSRFETVAEKNSRTCFGWSR